MTLAADLDGVIASNGNIRGCGRLFQKRASAVEIIKTILAMQNRFIPPTLNLTVSDPACDLDYVPQHARAGNIDIALVNNSSFGGKNSAVVLRRWQE